MYIATYRDGSAVVVAEEADTACADRRGHDFAPESGAASGINGAECARCGHFAGTDCEFDTLRDALDYATAAYAPEVRVRVIY